MPALIFDCDGVLADTERDGHLPAFNATFEHFGLPLRWTTESYAEKVRIGGGKERMASVLTPEFIQVNGLPEDPEELREVVGQWHKYKTAQYTSLIDSGVLPTRPGITRLIRAAHEAGWKLAVASTSARPSVEAVLRQAVGDEIMKDFKVFAGDDVPRKKPSPDIYLMAVEGLDADPEQTVVIEDSEIGLRAAHAAGLRTIVTVSGYTAGENFEGASLVVSSLGEPEGVGSETLAAAPGIEPEPYISLHTLHRVLDADRPPRSEPEPA